MSGSYAEDVRQIELKIEDMFAAICWSPDSPPDWDGFKAPCLPQAMLVPSARPAKTTDLEAFAEMMQQQRANGGLVDFEERLFGHHVRVFGNIAIALSAYGSKVNKGEEGRGVNGFLFVKNDGDWKVAAMCWDTESENNPIPQDLLT